MYMDEHEDNTCMLLILGRHSDALQACPLQEPACFSEVFAMATCMHHEQKEDDECYPHFTKEAFPIFGQPCIVEKIAVKACKHERM